MTLLEHALKLAEEGFYVFPLLPNKKKPPSTMTKWEKKATRDEKTIREWWAIEDYNIGIFTGKFGDGKALIVVDVDVKNGKKGWKNYSELLELGIEMPPSRVHDTPTGGIHLIYIVEKPLKSRVNHPAKHIDIRSGGAYIVGPGSTLPEGEYRVRG